MLLLAPALLGISLLDAAIMGAVVAAVSPAVVVPRMLKLMEEGYGTNHSIPQLILAVPQWTTSLSSSFSPPSPVWPRGGTLSPATFLQVPVSVVTGLLFGAVAGVLFGAFYRRFHVRDSAKVVGAPQPVLSLRGPGKCRQGGPSPSLAFWP